MPKKKKGGHDILKTDDTSSKKTHEVLSDETKKKIEDVLDEQDILDEVFFSHSKYADGVPEDLFADESSGKKRIPLNLSEEEREKRKKEHEEKQECDRIEREKREKHYQELEELGYFPLYNRDCSLLRIDYEERFKQVMGRNDIFHVSAIPQHIEEQKDSTAVQLFSSLSGLMVSSQPERYTTELNALLEKYEQAALVRYLNTLEYDQIMKCFILGYIDDPKLFYRFEQLKKLDHQMRIRRIFLYGRDLGEDSTTEKHLVERIVLDDRDMRFLCLYLRHKHILTIEDICPDTEEFRSKIKLSYKQNIKKQIGAIPYDEYHSYLITSLLPDTDVFSFLSPDEQDKALKKIQKYFYLNDSGRRDTMLDFERNPVAVAIQNNDDDGLDLGNDTERRKRKCLDGFYSHEMQKVLGVSREVLNTWVSEAKNEFILEFPGFVDRLSFDFLCSEEYIGTNHDACPFAVVVDKIPLLLELIKEALPFYPDIQLDISSLTSTVIQKLQLCVQEGIQKIKEKDKPDNVVYGKRKSLSYKNHINGLRVEVSRLCKVLSDLDPQTPEFQDRETNKEMYIQEYVDHHKQQVPNKKIDAILNLEQLELHQKDEIREMIIRNTKQELIDCCNKKMEKNGFSSLYSYKNLISNFQFIKMINQEILFKKGYFSLMKKMIPDDKERKEFRRLLVVDILAQNLSDVQKRLSLQETFDAKSYFLIDPLLYRYKKYQGDPAKIMLKRKPIDANYLMYLQELMEGAAAKAFTDVEKKLQKNQKNKEKIVALYHELIGLFSPIYLYIKFFLQKKGIDSRAGDCSIQSHGEEFEKQFASYEGEYPRELIFVFAHLWRFDIHKLQAILPKERWTYFEQIFTKIAVLKKEVWTKILGYWFMENTVPGGKLQRVLDQELFMKFGHTDFGDEQQIDFAIAYILEHMDDIVLDDVQRDVFSDYGSFVIDHEIIKEILDVLMQQWKKSLDAKRLGGNYSSLRGQ